MHQMDSMEALGLYQMGCLQGFSAKDSGKAPCLANDQVYLLHQGLVLLPNWKGICQTGQTLRLVGAAP